MALGSPLCRLVGGWVDGGGECVDRTWHGPAPAPCVLLPILPVPPHDRGDLVPCRTPIFCTAAMCTARCTATPPACTAAGQGRAGADAAGGGRSVKPGRCEGALNGPL